MLHKQIVFAAIAVTALMGMIVPLTAVPAAHAQVDTQGLVDSALDAVFGGDDAAEDAGGDGGDGGQSGDDNQNIDQTNEQNQEAEQEVDQENDQSEENTQSNTLETGANTATVTQANAADQAVEAAAAAEAGDSEAEAEDEDDGKDKKHHYSSSSDSDSTTADANSIATATAEATGIIDQDNVNAIEQDSSANDNILANVNEFGDDENTQVAVPIIDQDQTAENRAVNLDLDEEYGNVVQPDDDEEVCPEGFELETITVNAPGGQREISVCVEPEEEE